MSLWEDYEYQYGVLTAEITAKIGQLGLSSVNEKRKYVIEIDKHMEEAQELLEQMELEVRELPSDRKSRYRTCVDSYKAELGRLSVEFVKSKTSDPSASFQSDTFYNEPLDFREEQKQRLLDNSERIERSGRQLQEGYRVLLETEEIGIGVMRDLHGQRETIERSRNRLRETDAELSRGARIVNSMIARSMQHKFLLYFIAALLGFVLIVSVYLSIRK